MQQTHNNIDNAMNLLLEWQVQANMGVSEQQLEEASSSEEEAKGLDQEMKDMQLEKKVKVKKVDELTYSDTVKKT